MENKTQHTPESVLETVLNNGLIDEILTEDEQEVLVDLKNESSLYAACPDMLEALEEIRIDLNSNQIETARKRIEAAINKAKNL